MNDQIEAKKLNSFKDFIYKKIKKKNNFFNFKNALAQ